MGSPKGKWKLVNKHELVDNITYEFWVRHCDNCETFDYEWHFHLPSGSTITFSGWGGEKVKLFTKQHSLKCLCGGIVEVPDANHLAPFPDPSWESAYAWSWLKHLWEKHRTSYPPEIKNITEFRKWLKTPEGKAWDDKTYQKYYVLNEAEQILNPTEKE